MRRLRVYKSDVRLFFFKKKKQPKKQPKKNEQQNIQATAPVDLRRQLPGNGNIPGSTPLFPETSLLTFSLVLSVTSFITE